jgi:glucokinase
MGSETILVGDAGGTNVRLALAHVSDGRVSVSDPWKRPGADYPSFDDALDAFLAEHTPRLTGAAFGFAGAVSHGRVALLHRNWTVDRAALCEKLGLAQVVVVNDFFAMARGAAEIAVDEMDEISPGRADPEGAIAVGGPGTGFGIAILRRVQDGWIVVAGEGGHQSYGPQTDLEWRVAENLRDKDIYVSNEIIAAGAGFAETRAALAVALGVPDPNLSQADIIAAADTGDAFALEFCRLRARCVMTAMGNLALVANATGGVRLAGGVSGHLAPWLKEPATLARFHQRGPRTALLTPIPIHLITTQTAPLLGAAHLWLDQKARGWL